MAPEDNQNAKDRVTDSVELEMAAQRAEWQRNREKLRKIRVFSFSFLSLVIVGTVIVLFLIFNRVEEVREQRSASSPSPTISPYSVPPR